MTFFSGQPLNYQTNSVKVLKEDRF